MKISKNTIEVLKNFASINSNILIRKGDLISTISTGKNIFAKAKITENFDREFAIYDLNTLLATISLADDTDIELLDECLKIDIDSGTLEYYYSDPKVVLAAPDKDIEVDNYYQFNLSEDTLSTVFKTAAVSQATMLTVVGDGTNVKLKVGDPTAPKSNNYQKIIGSSDKVFTAHLPIETLKIIPDEYAVTISTKKFMYLESTTGLSRYWLALDKSSEI